jgi:anthranilate phosphoribosyltransferase
MPCATLAQAQSALDEERLAFVPTAVLCPALASLLALRHRLGTENIAHTLVKLIDPFHGDGVAVISASRQLLLGQLEAVISGTNREALLLHGTEDEPFANPRQRPRIVHVRQGHSTVLFEEEAVPARGMVNLPKRADSSTTAEWIALALNGEAPVPYPLANQFACCLYASGYTDDMNQAKAIAAVEAGGLGAPPGTVQRSPASIPR